MHGVLHTLRDVCHFTTCLIILFWSFMPSLFLFPLPSRACESDVWWYRSWEFHEQNSNSVLTGRITGARCTIWHVSRKSTQRLHCSKFSIDTATFTKQVDFKVELLPWLCEIAKLARLREIAKINTRKIIGNPKLQNFVLANNSNNKVASRGSPALSACICPNSLGHLGAIAKVHRSPAKRTLLDSLSLETPPSPSSQRKFALQASTLRQVCIQKTIWRLKCDFWENSFPPNECLFHLASVKFCDGPLRRCPYCARWVKRAKMIQKYKIEYGFWKGSVHCGLAIGEYVQEFVLPGHESNETFGGGRRGAKQVNESGCE